MHVPRFHCFVRGVIFLDEGTVLDSYNRVGVETLSALQIELSGPHASLEEASAAAIEIAQILNLEICSVSQTPTRRELNFSTLYLSILRDEVYQRKKRTAHQDRPSDHDHPSPIACRPGPSQNSPGASHHRVAPPTLFENGSEFRQHFIYVRLGQTLQLLAVARGEIENAGLVAANNTRRLRARAS